MTRWMTAGSLGPPARWLLSAALALMPSLAAPQAPVARIEALVTEAMKQWEVPGLGLAIVENGKVVLLKGYGVRRLGRPEPVDGQTVFSIGSSTKAFASAAVALLVDDGRLKWDDRVVDHLPWFRLPDPWTTSELRVRDLLTMRAGTTSLNQLREVAADRRDFLTRLRYAPAPAGFRDQFGYTNDMYILSGQLVETTAGTTWDEFVTRRIWQPLGMKTATSRMAKSLADPNHAEPHMIRQPHVGHQKSAGVPLVPVVWEFSDDVGVPAGGVNASAADMAEWIKFQLGAAGKDLLSERTRRLLHAPQTVIADPSWWMTAEHQVAYAMGWATGEFLGERVVFHGGEEPGYNAQVVLLADRGFGLFIGVNRNSLAPYYLAKVIIAAYLGRLEGRDWSREYVQWIDRWNAETTRAEKARETGRILGVGPSLPLARYVGRFENQMTGTVVVTQAGDRLVAELAARDGPIVLPLEHWHIDQFITRIPPYNYRIRVTFAIDEAGEVTNVNLAAFGEFRRVAP